MAQQTINIGTAANDGTGDALRTAFGKTNGNFDELYAVPLGQALLAKSGANIVLSRCRGKLITINGVRQVIPAGGVSLAPTGLTVGTLYYVYAYMNSGVMALEAATTGHAVSASAGNEGVEIKIGDDSRSLVGFVQPVTGPAFADTPQNRLVRSWFNRSRLNTSAAFTASRSTTNTSYVEINSEIRCGALLWADEVWSVGYNGSMYNTASGASVVCAIAFDSTSSGLAAANNNIGGTFATPAGLRPDFVGSEGFHYVTLIGKVSSGTGSWDLASYSTATLSGLIS